MLRKYLAGLAVLPVLLAAWLTFRTEPVVGIPLSQVVMYEAPAETSETATESADSINLN